MKRILLPVLIVCLLLSGCGSRENEKRFAEFSETLAVKENLSFTSRIRAEYDDRTLEFTLAYQKDADGQTVRVKEPERISGVKAHLAAGSSTLEFEGLILDTGPLDPYGLTPMNALPKLIDTLRTGHLDSTWEETGSLVCRLILDDHLSVSVWFEPERMIPVYAELQSDETVHIFCEISEWS